MIARLRARRAAREAAADADAQELIALIAHIRRVRDQPLSADLAGLLTRAEMLEAGEDHERAVIQGWFAQALASMQPGAARRSGPDPAPMPLRNVR